MPRGKILFVTGTDTGVGKTYVACGLLRALRAAGRAVAARKPAETGCAPGAGEVLFPADAAALREAAGAAEPLAAVCNVRLAEPLAPAVAAARAGVAIDFERLCADCLARAAEVDVLVVEGAGGLLVPLAGPRSFADLARDIGAELLLVVGARLGAINHALLTVEVARNRGLDVRALVVNQIQPTPDLATETLKATLCDLAGVPTVVEVGHREDAAAALTSFARVYP
jgi:dethiobiotin synthetase